VIFRLTRVRAFVEHLLRETLEAWRRSAGYDLRHIPGLTAGRNLRVCGLPLIEIAEGASIRIGDDVVLNSMNRGYHINMHSPVKLMADWSGAIIEIGSETRVHGSCIHAWASVRVGKRCLVASNCQIMDSNGHELCLEEPERRVRSQDLARPVTIEDAVWIGANSIILPGVTIGYGSIIAAGSVVTHDIPPRVLAGGNPARVLPVSKPSDRQSAVLPRL
jgi:acetyltransferase-like isoleucine patch superfamily enzyme